MPQNKKTMIQNYFQNFLTYVQKVILLKTSLKLSLVVIALLGSLVSVNAQNVKTDYAFSESIGNAYVDMTGGTTVFEPSGASHITAITAWNPSPIGFNFVFNNVQYSEVYISDNGFFIFKAPIGVTNLPAVTAAGPLNSTFTYPGAVSGFGANLIAAVGDAGDVTYLTTGAPWQSGFTVQYRNLRRWDGVTQEVLQPYLIFKSDFTRLIIK
jgi:hypothetical protein